VLVDAQAGPTAQTGFARCASQAGVLCRHVSVPLDYSKATPGRLRLFVTMRPADRTPKGTILLLAGGPGQASAQTFTLTSDLWRSLFPGYTVAPMTTGDISEPTVRRPAARCARAIGPRRVFYGTRENAKDVEAVRRALGVDRIALFGISYGTRQALAYARAYPEHVERLLLDSVVPSVDGADPLDLASLEAISSALGSICHRGVAGGQEPRRGLRRARQPLDGRLVGQAKSTWTVDSEFRRSLDGLGPRLAGQRPRAGVAIGLPGGPGRRSTAAPAARAHGRAPREPLGGYQPRRLPRTTCNDGPFSWASTPVGRRRAVLEGAIARSSRRTRALRAWAACLPRLPASVASATGSAAPASRSNVPVLVLAGDRDVRTPLRRARSPHASPRPALVVPGVGRMVVVVECANRAIRRWIAGGMPPARCPVSLLTIGPRARPSSRRRRTPLGSMARPTGGR
jgi:pimeloyl-ACP methyl ester carboxylesterase